MQLIGALILLFGIVSPAFSYPSHYQGIPEQDDSPFVRVPLRKRLFSDDIGLRGLGEPKQFDDLLKEMEESIKRLQKEIEELADKPAFKIDHADSGSSSSVFIGGDFDPSKFENKTTSKTEVINGQLVQINETVYSAGDEHNGQVFRFKSVKVLPKDDEEKSETPKLPEQPAPESDAAEKKFEVAPKDDSNQVVPQNREELENNVNSGSVVKRSGIVQLDVPNNIDSSADNAEFDLSRDTLVNDYYFQQNGGPQGMIRMDPDAELINIQ